MLLTGGSVSEKTNVLLSLIKEQDNDEFVYKIYFYLKLKWTIISVCNWKKCEDVGMKHLNDSKAFIEYLQCMDDVYKNIND